MPTRASSARGISPVFPMRNLLGVLTAAVLVGGCAAAKKPAAAPAPVAANSQAAQKRAYDRGVALFGEEKYEQARRAWKDAVSMGPATPIGKKAKDNLDKVETILKSLQEIEAQ